MKRLNATQKSARRGWLDPVAKGIPTGLFLLFGLLANAFAQEADLGLIDEGMRIYKTRAACGDCHGWTGRGGMANDEPENDPGPSLVHSELDREALIEIVSCGAPWPREMPHYLATAWSKERPCYGMVAAELSPDRRPPRPDRTLRPSQIEAVVTYVQEVYQGKGMTLEYCIKYYSPTSRACDRYR